jgi:hypothetical protein
MPFTDTTPASWLGAGYNTQSGKIELNTNDAAVNKLLTELTDAEADENSGDIRKLIFGVIDGLFTKLRAKNTSLAPADRPVNMTFSRGTNVNEATGILTRQYTFTFQLEAASVEVADEPA